MSKTSIIIFFLILTGIVISLGGCSKDEEPRIGEKITVEGIWSWSFQSIVNCEERSDNTEFFLACGAECLLYEFLSDGTVILQESGSDQTLSGTYESTNNLVTVTFQDDRQEFLIRTTDDRLLIKQAPITIGIIFDPSLYGKDCEINVYFEKQ